MDTKIKIESKSSRDNGRVERSSFRRDRPAPYSRDGRVFRPGPRAPPFWRVFVNNIPYEEKWQNLKDTFRREVGEVTYVELFKDEQGNSRGYGVVEFKDKETCELAIEKMNRYEIGSRKLVIKADYDGDIVKKMLMRDGVPGRLGPPMPGMPPPMPGRHGPLPPMPPPMGGGNRPMRIPPMAAGSERGMPPMIGGTGPIGKTVFVANLDYKVTYSKLKEVFSLAGHVVKVDLMLDKDNKSRGMATVTYDDAMEAQQAISMLNQQKLYERTMIVKMDKDNFNDRNGPDLPSGLAGIGPPLTMRRDHGGIGDGPMSRGGGPVGGLSQSNILGLSSLSSSIGNNSDLGGIRDLHKNGSSNSLAIGLSALNQQASRLSETLQSGSLTGGNLGLTGFTGIGLNDLSSLGSNRESYDQRLLDQHRLRLLASARGGNTLSDRERIEMDIARVDNRIRDIDRSLAATERGGYNSSKLPPMPPPMGSMKSGPPRGGVRMPGTTVFVRNLPYSLTWQKLRDKFARCGNVMYADIKTDNGRSRGFGNVRFETPDQAEAAVRYFNGFEMDGRMIDVHVDTRV